MLKSNRKIKVYTTGYTGKDVSDLKPLLAALDAVLFDVRYSPDSRVLKWTRDYLQVKTVATVINRRLFRNQPLN